MYWGRGGAATGVTVDVGSGVEVVGDIGGGVDASVKVGAMSADTGVGTEQEADKRISDMQNERCKKVINRLTNHIVSENLLINHVNIF